MVVGARNHVAGQAVRDGLDANGDKVTYDNPGTDQLARHTAAHGPMPSATLSDLEVLTENPRSSQELIGFTAQQALENALKGWISALDARVPQHPRPDEASGDCAPASGRKRHLGWRAGWRG